jgi:hypothetical protein
LLVTPATSTVTTKFTRSLLTVWGIKWQLKQI